MVLLRSSAAAAVVLLALSACADSPEASAVTADALNGSTFTSTEVTGHELVAGSSISLNFEDGRLAVKAGCNTMSGSYAVADGKLRWEGGAIATRMACDEALMNQDQWLTTLFTDGVTPALADSTLTLKSGDVVITATK